jgi:hypothetical protein
MPLYLVLQALPVFHLREICVDSGLHSGLFIDPDEAEHQRLIVGFVVGPVLVEPISCREDLFICPVFYLLFLAGKYTKLSWVESIEWSEAGLGHREDGCTHWSRWYDVVDYMSVKIVRRL